MAELCVIGLNHRTAPVAVREPFALPGDTVLRLLRAFRAGPALEESLLLATCNRTELYAVPRAGHDPLAHFLEHLGHVRGGPVSADPAVFYRYDGLEAARHLFRVAASLDSQILGEHQILGQVKDAYRLAVQARTAGFLLNRLLHRSFRVGKRVQGETQLGCGSVGVATAAVELARQIFSTLQGRTVLLVGAGQNAECAALAILRAGALRLIVANRTVERARQLAHDIVQPAACDPCPLDETAEGAATCSALRAAGAVESDPRIGAPPPAGPQVATEAIGLEDLAAAVARADLVITSTGSPQAVLTRDALAPVLCGRRRPVFIIDIAVPRDVDPRLAEVDNVFLYNLDDLDRLVARNLERRRAEVPRAEAIVEDELGAFAAWLSRLEVAPTLRLLNEWIDAQRRATIDRYGRKFTEADREQLERFTQTLGSRFLARPVEFLKALSENGSTSERLAAVDLVRRMFGLDEPEK
jgi:glutamyl-tRNA reductase